jgi:hypothetical protein
MSSINPPGSRWQLKTYWIFSMLGWIIIILSLVLGIVVLSSTASGYWGGNTKAVRDAAVAGSSLLGQLRTLAVTPRWLEPLTFLGVALFMLGIALEFSSIPKILRNRGEVLKASFPLVVRHGAGNNG